MSYPITNTSKNPCFILSERNLMTSFKIEIPKTTVSQLREELEQYNELFLLSEVFEKYYLNSEIEWNKKEYNPSTILSPNFEALKTIAVHYKTKYDIQIEVCPDNQLEPVLKSFESQKLFGVIMTSQMTPQGHVTPILCDFRTSQKIIFDLDVMGEAHSDLDESPIQNACKNLNLNLIRSKDPRQASLYECRIGALVTLRNALLDPVEDGPDLLSHYSDLAKELPATWTYTDQITSRVFKEEKVSEKENVVRDLHSSKEEKKIDPKNLLNFRESYYQDLQIQYNFYLKKGKIDSKFTQKNIKTPNITVKNLTNRFGVRGFDYLKISWIVTKKCNGYMAAKARIMAERLEIPIIKSDLPPDEEVEEPDCTPPSQILDAPNYKKRTIQNKCSFLTKVAFAIAVTASGILLKRIYD